MPWARFVEDFNWRPSYGVTVAYKTGMVLNVTRACAEAAGDKVVAARKEERDGKA